MMEPIRAKNMSVLQAYGREPLVMFEVDRSSIKSLQELSDELQGKDISLEIKRHREKRSLDANAYCWVMIGRLAAKIGNSPENIYRETIKDIGENYYIVPVKDEAVDRFLEVWKSKGVGWLTDTLESKLEGYTNIMCYYGSSQYDKAQMSRLIDLIVSECKEQGIETKTPDEIELMKARWADE